MSGSGEGTGDWGGFWATVTGTPGVTRTSGWGEDSGFLYRGVPPSLSSRAPSQPLWLSGGGSPGRRSVLRWIREGSWTVCAQRCSLQVEGWGLYASSGSGCPRSMVRSTGHLPVPSTLGLGSQNQKTPHTRPPPPQVSWLVILGHSPQLFAQHLKKLRPRQQREWRGPHTASLGRASGWLSPAVLPRQLSGRAGQHPPCPPSPCCCHEWS